MTTNPQNYVQSEDQNDIQSEDQNDIYLEISGANFKRDNYIRTKQEQGSHLSDTEARSHLTLYIIKVYAWSVGTILAVGLVVPFIPEVDKSFFKDFSQNILTSQAPIMTLLLGYYFGSQTRDDKE